MSGVTKRVTLTFDIYVEEGGMVPSPEAVRSTVEHAISDSDLYDDGADGWYLDYVVVARDHNALAWHDPTP